MTEHVQAWQCIGCGRIEAPQNCIGICQDRKVEFVYADEHEAAMKLVRDQMRALAGVVRQIAWITPRDGAWEQSYRALQEQARRVLASLAAEPDSVDGLSGAGG
ncbi:MAG TPA: hypothetical protein VFB20_08925 [Burkholderiales bacterium]|nr:hypothetical protein [Burkholderiales bacterium]